MQHPCAKTHRHSEFILLDCFLLNVKPRCTELEIGHFGAGGMPAGHGEGLGWDGWQQGNYRTWGTGHLGRKTEWELIQKGPFFSFDISQTQKRRRKKSFISFYWLLFLIPIVGIITQSGVMDTATQSWIKWALRGVLGNLGLGDMCVRKYILSFK